LTPGGLLMEATVSAQFAVVVGSWPPKAHGQQKTLTVASMRRPPGVKGKMCLLPPKKT